MRTVKRDYYEVLGLSRGAGEQEIKRAYRKLAKKYHPDMNQGNPQAEKMFQEVNEAYSVLNDPEKKKIYDTYGMAAFAEGMDPKKYAEAQQAWQQSGGYAGGNAQDASDFFRQFRGFHSGTDSDGTQYHTYHFEGGNAEDIFGDLFGRGFGHASGGSGFGGASGFGGNGSEWSGMGNSSYENNDLHSELTIGFDEAVYGCTKTIRLSSAAASGNNGMQTLQIRIPAGMEDGKSIRLKGRGNTGRNGRGDLYIKIHVEPRAGFSRRGRDIYTTAKIPFTTAVFGGEARVSTLKESVVCKIPAGMQCGGKIRLRGKGVPESAGKPAGDEYVTIVIQVPRTLSAEQKKALKEFEKASGGHSAVS